MTTLSRKAAPRVGHSNKSVPHQKSFLLARRATELHVEFRCLAGNVRNITDSYATLYLSDRLW